LSRHKAGHRMAKKHTCEMCGKQFHRADAYRGHLFYHNKGNLESWTFDMP
jgi:hypothetical protein